MRSYVGIRWQNAGFEQRDNLGMREWLEWREYDKLYPFTLDENPAITRVRTRQDELHGMARGRT
jgi:hypothetical protein